MPPQLVALTEGPNIPLDKPIVLIGRHQECDIQIPSRKISRRHCCVAQVYNYLVVRDLGSTNGVRINGTRAVEGKLQPGDELTIGNLSYRVQWDDHLIAAGPPKQARPPVGLAMHSGDDPIALPEPSHDIRVPQAKPAHPSSAAQPSEKSNDPPSALLAPLNLVPID
jgi:predicted component of type VI protein secretion system